MNANEIVKHVCEELLEHKGQEIEVLHIEHLTTLTEYFVICTATSTTQVRALADSVEFKLKHDYGVAPHHIEGFESNSWVLVDYGSVLLHVFLPESRQFYNLEHLWKDGVKIPLSELGIEEVQ